MAGGSRGPRVGHARKGWAPLEDQSAPAQTSHCGQAVTGRGLSPRACPGCSRRSVCRRQTVLGLRAHSCVCGRGDRGPGQPGGPHSRGGGSRPASLLSLPSRPSSTFSSPPPCLFCPWSSTCPVLTCPTKSTCRPLFKSATRTSTGPFRSLNQALWTSRDPKFSGKGLTAFKSHSRRPGTCPWDRPPLARGLALEPPVLRSLV